MKAAVPPDPRSRHPSAPACEWCGRKRADDHTSGCPAATGIYPVRLHEAGVIGCTRCPDEPLFGEGDSYTFVHGPAGWEMVCLGCAAVPGLRMPGGSPP